MARRHLGPLGTVYLDNDLRFVSASFVFDRGEGAEKELAIEGENRSAAAGDTALDEESGELSQEVMDFDGGVELGELVAEGRAQVDGVGVGIADGRVTEAQAGII